MGIFDKAKDLAGENTDKINDAVDQGADLVDEKTGGKYGEQIDQGSEFAKDKADYRARYKTKFDEIVRQAKEIGLAASVYTETSDVEGELNGLLTYDRAESKLPVGDFATMAKPLFDDGK